MGRRKTNALTISLSPLSDEETARLIGGLLEQALMPAETQAALLARAGGNPLYAEQYVRMLQERTGGELPLPENVQGIIAARLDVLEPEQKSLVQDAAAVGKNFWLGAVCAISGLETQAAETSLHALERKGFARRERETSIAGETEYAFLHVLVREVAYGQIPRAARADKHRLAAEWMESLGRPEDHAEMLVYHYGEALTLARAAGVEMASIAEPARRVLRDAGDRALALHAYAAALRFYEQALELWPKEDAQRPALLLRRAKAVFFWVDDSRVDLFDEARDALLAEGDLEGAAEAETLGALALRNSGEPLDALDRAHAAAAILEKAAASAMKAYVLANLARYLAVLADRNEEAIEVAGRALAMSEELGLSELQAHALNTIGLARVLTGDLAGIEDLENSLRLALEHASPFEIGRIYNNLDSGYLAAGRLREMFATTAALIAMRERYGLATEGFEGSAAFNDLIGGRWEEAAARIDALLASGDPSDEPDVRLLAATLLLARDDVAGAASQCELALAFVRGQQQDAEALALLHDLLCLRAKVALAAGRRDAASELADELLSLSVRLYPTSKIELVLLLADLGRPVDAVMKAASSRPADPWWEVAAAIARGELARAADRLAEMGALPFEAEVRRRAAAALIADGRRPEADIHLQKALAFWRSVGATRYIGEAEALLAATA